MYAFVHLHTRTHARTHARTQARRQGSTKSKALDRAGNQEQGDDPSPVFDRPGRQNFPWSSGVNTYICICKLLYVCIYTSIYTYTLLTYIYTHIHGPAGHSEGALNRSPSFDRPG